MKGYKGNLLRVNLTTKSVTINPLNPQYIRDFIGGSGLGIRLAYDEIPPNVNPLDPGNKLFFVTGPTTGTSLGTAGRYQVVFKSPLTGLLCDCSSGGYWGTALRQAGYDGLIIEGASETPVYLNIHDHEVEIRDASHHWGKDTLQVQKDIKQENGNDKSRIAVIGPAGEHGVSYGCIINDDARAAGRGGAGAVMGSKNLKAIAVCGSQEIDLADPEGFRRVVHNINRRNAKDPEMEALRKYGTADGLDSLWSIGNVPVKNWSEGSTEQICTAVGGKKIYELMPKKHASCHRCPISCSRWTKIDEGPYALDAPGPEYESAAALGTMCMVTDIKAVCYANHLCNLYGLDTISTGSSIAFAMECMERGLLSTNDTDGVSLRWGNKDAVIQMVHKIGKAEGSGRFIGSGTRRMAAKIGKGSDEFAVHVKGLELPMHDPRAGFAWAVNYATASRGGCHLHGMTDLYEDSVDPIPEWGFTGNFTRLSNDGKAEMARFAQNWAHILDSIVMCYFATIVLKPSDFCDLLNNAAGWDLSPRDLLIIGDRINALHRVYNYRCGVRRKDDTLPARVMMPLQEGGAAGMVPDLEGQIVRYYELRHWEGDGKPSQQSLLDLGLEDAARHIY